MKKLMTAAALATLLTGCVTFPTQESEQVKVIWDDVNAIANCQHLGTVMGSEAEGSPHLFTGTLPHLSL